MSAPDLDLNLVPIGFAILAACILVLTIWARARWVRLTLGGAMLLLSYLALQFSWDIWHEDMQGYVGTASGPGVLAFIFGPAGFILGIAAIALLATSWRAVSWRFVALAAVPSLVVMVYHAQEGGEIAKLQQERRDEWSHEQDAMNRHLRGRGWARQNHVTDFERCSQTPSSDPQFENNSDFQAGCLREVQDSRQMEGMIWAARRHPTADDNCEPRPSELAPPEGIEACKQKVRELRMQLGADWAKNNTSVAPADCERGFSEMSNRADYVAGCQRFVEDAARAKRLNWAIAAIADRALPGVLPTTLDSSP